MLVVVLEIGLQDVSEAFGRTRASLSKPEGMFKTDEDDETYHGKKPK